MATSLLVIPGQVIATSSEGDNFLKGHGTYIENARSNNEEHQEADKPTTRLVASVCGIVHRVNKLITVIPTSSTLYDGHVGDLVVGRIVGVGTSRWKVDIGNGLHKMAQLPLSGVHLPGGVQRVRTAQDQRDMRQFFMEGDLISAEVHNVQQNDHTLVLHTRSFRYCGKLENGIFLSVPSSLIPRRKHHYLTNILGTYDMLLGTNGNIWIQRKLFHTQHHNNNHKSATASTGATTHADMEEQEAEQLRKYHATCPITPAERSGLARLRNAIECVRLVHAMITPEHVQHIYQHSVALTFTPMQLLRPENVIVLTAFMRK